MQWWGIGPVSVRREPAGFVLNRPAPDEVPEAAVMRWAVRSSFRAYVASLPDGTEQVSDGAVLEGDGRVAFPVSSSDPGGGYAFAGSLSWRGHGGMLAVELRKPRVHLVARGRSTVSVSPPGRVHDELLIVAAFMEWGTAGDLLVLPAPRLTWAGVSLLGDVYEVGDVLDPIEISLASPTQR